MKFMKLHFFASMDRHSNAMRMSAESNQLDQEVNYLAAPQDNAWIASPWVCSPLPQSFSRARLISKQSNAEDTGAVLKSICANAIWASTANLDTTPNISVENFAKRVIRKV